MAFCLWLGMYKAPATFLNRVLKLQFCSYRHKTIISHCPVSRWIAKPWPMTRLRKTKTIVDVFQNKLITYLLHMPVQWKLNASHVYRYEYDSLNWISMTPLFFSSISYINYTPRYKATCLSLYALHLSHRYERLCLLNYFFPHPINLCFFCNKPFISELITSVICVYDFSPLQFHWFFIMAAAVLTGCSAIYDTVHFHFDCNHCGFWLHE